MNRKIGAKYIGFDETRFKKGHYYMLLVSPSNQTPFINVTIRDESIREGSKIELYTDMFQFLDNWKITNYENWK